MHLLATCWLFIYTTIEWCNFTLSLSWFFLRRRGVIFVIVPAFMLFSASRCLMMLVSIMFSVLRSAIDTPWMTIPYIGSWTLRPWNAAFQISSLVMLRPRPIFASSSVSNWRRMLFASLLTPMIWGLSLLKYTRFIACWQRSAMFLADMELSDRCASVFISFIVKVTPYFARSWRKVSRCLRRWVRCSILVSKFINARVFRKKKSMRNWWGIRLFNYFNDGELI